MERYGRVVGIFENDKSVVKMSSLDSRRVLIVCHCPMRGKSIGLIGVLLSQFSSLMADGLKVNLFDTDFFQDHKEENYEVNHYYNIQINRISKLILKVPKLRTWYIRYRILADLKRIVGLEKYDLVILYNVPSYSDCAVKLIQNSGAKVALFPWGSEVLRAKGKSAIHVKNAYMSTDFIVGTENSNLIRNAMIEYKVPYFKIREQKPFLKGVKTIIDVSGKLSRQEMSEKLGIPYTDYNIICAYNGNETQRHRLMIDAISCNKQYLPDKYQLVFPITYGAPEGYIEELQNLCISKQLNACFLTEHLSDIQIAYIHLITDLYINIQPSDTGNAFMIESLFCGNQIITGSWLHYSQFEQYGIPYYLIKSLDDLTPMLKGIFAKEVEPIVVPDKLKEKYAITKDSDSGEFWKELLQQL